MLDIDPRVSELAARLAKINVAKIDAVTRRLTEHLQSPFVQRLLAPWRSADAATKKKPVTLVYGLEERPPTAVIWFSGLQHIAVIAIFLVYPLLMAREAGLPANQVVSMMQWCLIVLAIATLLQALARGPVGGRLLAPSIFTGVYLAPSLLALKAGGLPLLWGMTIVSGLTEAMLARLWSRLRPFIPPESAGLVVFLVGVIIGLAALRLLVEESPSRSLPGPEAMVVGCALAVMIGLNIWNKGRLRLFCILIGMVIGYVVSAAVGLLRAHDIAEALSRPPVAIPSLSHLSWAFDWDLLIPFAVTGLAAAMSAAAVVTTYQRITDAEWVRPDMVTISRGILGDGIATMVAGLLGTYGLSISTANVGLVAATGVASRVIAFAVALLLGLVALQPTLLGILIIMPRPVMAAALLFTCVFIMINGIQIISSRVLDARRTLVIGMGILAFVAVSVYPAAFANTPTWAHPLVTSPLVLATLVALSLNLVFRIGVRRKVDMAIEPGKTNAQEIADFIERNAGLWGARRDVVDRVEFAVQQTIETIIDACKVNGPIRVDISYDEFDIDVVLTYRGTPLEFPDQVPTLDEILDSEGGHHRLAGFLVKRHADRMSATNDGASSVVRLHFQH